MDIHSFDVTSVWLADDDSDDLQTFEDCIKEIKPTVDLKIFRSGQELLNALDHNPMPHLIFLDIRMPCRNGQECLAEIRSKRKYDRLPIIIYSGSGYEIDITYSYGVGANLYVRKPTTYFEMHNIIKKLLYLDWSKPEEITSTHFISGKYVPFMAQ